MVGRRKVEYGGEEKHVLPTSFSLTAIVPYLLSSSPPYTSFLLPTIHSFPPPHHTLLSSSPPYTPFLLPTIHSFPPPPHHTLLREKAQMCGGKKLHCVVSALFCIVSQLTFKILSVNCKGFVQSRSSPDRDTKPSSHSPKLRAKVITTPELCHECPHPFLQGFSKKTTTGCLYKKHRTAF